MTTEPSPRRARELTVSRSVLVTLVLLVGVSSVAVVVQDRARSERIEVAAASVAPAPGLVRAGAPRRVVVVRRSRAS